MPTQSASLLDRRQFAALGASTLLAAQAPPKSEQPEWRNKQPGMSYRRLGRTNLMVSEVVSGGDPIRSDNWEQLKLAEEMGLNYLDMAPAYNGGDTEVAYGKFLGGSSARRMKFILTTKVSGLQGIRNRLYKEIYDGLPAEKQSAILKRSEEMMAERMVMKPGYFLDYYPGIRNQPPAAYLSNAMMKDYGHKVDGSAAYRKFIMDSIEGSLKRVGTDHFDLLMCPHGACTPEELDIPEIRDLFATLKSQGKVRFLGLTSHTGPADVLRHATTLGHYDAAMCAYNVINGGYMDHAITQAHARGIGVIAMKSAMAVATHHKSLQPVPQWRIDKIHRVIPGDMKAPLKAYIWSLQHPGLTAVISNLWDETYVRENLSVAGKKVQIQFA
jgi:aryl-alcohol dehydrogenase-like predicted oxidoreductase